MFVSEPSAVSMDRQNEIEAIARVFQAHYGVVIGAALKYVPTPDLAYDVVQHTFIDFMENQLKEKKCPERDVPPLLYRIAQRRAIKLWHEHRRRLTNSETIIAERLMTRSRERGETPERLDRQTAWLKECLDLLPENGARFIKMHYHEGIPMREIAERLDMKPGTVRQIIARIRLKLRRCIEKKENASNDQADRYTLPRRE